MNYFRILIFLSLFLNVNSYDDFISKYFVKLSQAAYCVDNIYDWNCITCENSIDLEYIIEEHGAKALQGYDSETDTIFTAFRGSSNFENWLDNIQIEKISPYNDENIKVEKGFYKAYNYLKPELIDNLVTLTKKYNTNRLSITGHSLGAAESTLFAYELMTIYKNYKISYFYNFGSPRVGNKEFVDSFMLVKIPSYRVTHYHDVVPHVPEELIGYSHVPHERWYNEDNSEYIVCNDFNGIEDNDCSNSCAPLDCTSIKDHLNYLNISMGKSDENC